MRKVGFVFVLAVFVPSLVLAYLAFLSLRSQQFMVERHQALLHQQIADSIASDTRRVIAEHQKEFSQQVETFLAQSNALAVAQSFDELIRNQWPIAEVGFAVTLPGNIFSPSLFGGPEARRFRLDNDRFLCSRESVEVYWQTGKEAPAPSKKDEVIESSAHEEAGKFEKSSGSVKNSKRTVAPVKESPETSSKSSAAEAQFKFLVGNAMEGTVARFLQDELKLMCWYRSSRDPEIIFGAQLDLKKLVENLKPVIRVAPEVRNEIALALLNEGGKPLVVDPPQFKTDWNRPFVAAEIGEVLPHWELALYLRNPKVIAHSAQNLRLTIGLLIALLVVAIAIGGWLIVRDLDRQLRLARQKTDFVSNVSHELKTPLTSIRMFSDLLAEGRVDDPVKARSYLGIISAETARLTRLINNVLDFARLERGETQYQFKPLDFVDLVRSTLQTYHPQLQAAGFKVELILPQNPVMVNGEPDALAQVIMNLLSNAEKYSGTAREITVKVDPALDGWVELSVMDRGLGVPAGAEEKIFEQFYRAHDSLSSGIPGSGLGLSLARQIARLHRGDIQFRRREEGGSCFCLKLPVLPLRPTS